MDTHFILPFFWSVTEAKKESDREAIHFCVKLSETTFILRIPRLKRAGSEESRSSKIQKWVARRRLLFLLLSNIRHFVFSKNSEFASKNEDSGIFLTKDFLV
ncbi:hypothetical protein CEXT_518101 [Caerostris extrusa]|uniref:Ribosomal protein L32 n=1 Tax=Caerostris extrusa TaxID=172846 RepID=A0AAV4SNF9_CAEEX|nr:hypothetical protein CEXT_518101 [Caerostris extrusa]